MERLHASSRLHTGVAQQYKSTPILAATVTNEWKKLPERKKRTQSEM